mmetsp:Transcript_6663/g.12878  ORF Transcript_6663/g.12878 Transcript_6663/m.12878 type:complete len:261 (+) Transcript_6663:365-1147(+)
MSSGSSPSSSSTAWGTGCLNLSGFVTSLLKFMSARSSSSSSTSASAPAKPPTLEESTAMSFLRTRSCSWLWAMFRRALRVRGILEATPTGPPPFMSLPAWPRSSSMASLTWAARSAKSFRRMTHAASRTESRQTSSKATSASSMSEKAEETVSSSSSSSASFPPPPTPFGGAEVVMDPGLDDDGLPKTLLNALLAPNEAGGIVVGGSSFLPKTSSSFCANPPLTLFSSICSISSAPSGTSSSSLSLSTTALRGSKLRSMT